MRRVLLGDAFRRIVKPGEVIYHRFYKQHYPLSEQDGTSQSGATDITPDPGAAPAEPVVKS